MATLRDRQRQIPNGFRFRLPEVNYTSQPFQSFDTIVGAVHAIAQANPGLFMSKQWPMKRSDIADWVDEFNARICAESGWLEYVNGGEDTPPKHGPPPGRVGAVAAGARSLTDWITGGADPVLNSEATVRAEVCSKCPMNKEGDLSNFFERATSEMIKASLAAAKDVKMVTRFDSKLGVCEACYCPMKLKIWMPIGNILKHMSDETFNELHPTCWIRSEKKS